MSRELAPHFRIAAGSIEADDWNHDAGLLSFSATGQVYLEATLPNFRGLARCESASYADGVLILKGWPLVRTASRRIEALSSATVMQVNADGEIHSAGPARTRIAAPD